MSLTYGFYNAVNHDRTYDAIQLSSIFDGIIKDGIFQSIGTALEPTASGDDMVVNVGIGRAWFNHTWTFNDSVLPIDIPISEVVLNRIDALILEVNADENVRANSIKILKGTPGVSPERPELTNTLTIHQYPLAYINVGAGVTAISQSDITSMIGTETTPFITGILDTLSIDVLVAQWQSEFSELITDNGTIFDEWFQHLRDELDSNQAANLQNQIDELTTSIDSDITARLDGLKLKALTQAEYDALETKDENTLYFIKEA